MKEYFEPICCRMIKYDTPTAMSKGFEIVANMKEADSVNAYFEEFRRDEMEDIEQLQHVTAAQTTTQKVVEELAE